MSTRRLRSALAALAVALLLLPVPAHADDAGVWANELLMLDLKQPGHKTGWQVSLDFHERAWGPNYLAIVRPGLGYDVGHGMTVWLGYAFVPSFVSGSGDPAKLEHRVWEQFLANEKVGVTALTGRLRLEQRFLQGTPGVGERLRIYARAGFFFGRSSHWGWALSDEVLVKLNTTDAWSAGFDQNRAFTGPFFQADSGVRVEFGYLNFLQDKKDVGLYDSHVAMVNLTVPIQVFQPKKDAHAAAGPGVASDLGDPEG